MSRLLVAKDGPERSPIETFSDRELEVFQLVGRGLTAGELANRLHLSPRTIEAYRQRLKTKLNLKNAGESSREAVQWVLEWRSRCPSACRDDVVDSTTEFSATSRLSRSSGLPISGISAWSMHPGASPDRLTAPDGPGLFCARQKARFIQLQGTGKRTPRPHTQQTCHRTSSRHAVLISWNQGTRSTTVRRYGVAAAFLGVYRWAMLRCRTSQRCWCISWWLIAWTPAQ